MVRAGQFRQDLFYRINVLPIHIPPLRERLPDIAVFVEHFLFTLASRLDEPVKPVTPEALDKLRRHDWPGNVRELKNVVERAAILAAGDRIAPETAHGRIRTPHRGGNPQQRQKHSKSGLLPGDFPHCIVE